MLNISLKKTEFPYSYNEEIKQIRTNIEYSGTDNKVIMVTSAASGDGKSTLTLELCRSFADLGKTVLLVDADLRKSTLHRFIVSSGPKPRGLSYFLSGQSELENVLCRTENPNLYCIFSGRVPPNPSELLSNKRMEAFMKWAREKFDYVFIDCPPITLVTDASVITTHADASIAVIKSGSTTRRDGQAVIKQLERLECPIIGVVLNQVKPAYNRKSGYGYYGG